MTEEIQPIAAASRYRVVPASGADVTENHSPTSRILHQLPQDTLIVCAEVRAGEGGRERVRVASPAGWLDADVLAPVGRATRLSLDYKTFKARHLDVMPGDHYGLEFPISLSALREWGPRFLTEAFRAAGTLPEENRVTEIGALAPVGHPGASDAAFLTVAYANSDPDLHTELFVKLSPTPIERKFTVVGMALGEVTMNRRSAEGLLPVPVAKYYFGDYCHETSNFILITERVAFGKGPIEPAYVKGYDQHVPEVEEHYQVLAESLGRCVAAHKRGAMGYDLEGDFPFAQGSRRFPFIDGAEAKIDQLIDFIARVAPKLFVEEATDPSFLAIWREDLLFGLSHQKEVYDYLHANVDYTGLCHPNLNIDNAWYWRDTSGALQTGWLDLGGFGQMSIGQALSCMLMMPEPARYLKLQRDVMAAFIRTCEAEGGPSLDAEEIRLQYKASVFPVSIALIIGSCVELLSQFSDEDYATMSDWLDPRLQESGLACLIIWIDNVLRDWLDDLTPGEACRRIVAGS